MKSLIDKGVKYATDNNMYVIIDWHILSDGNPNTHKSDAKKFFGEMSKKYAKYDNVLYEICNEPNGATTWKDIKNYAKDIIKEIRKNDKDCVIIVGTPNWCQYLLDACNDRITGHKNICYSLHFYAATHKDDLRSTLKNALKKGLPVFVSEFGICDASGSGNIDENEAEKWLNLLDRNKISYVMWNLSNKNETSALLKSSCNKVNKLSKSSYSKSGLWYQKYLRGQ